MKIKIKNIWRVIWISGIYALLLLILYLVVTYKVEWQDKDLNTYLYFYNCSNRLCTSTSMQPYYYNKILCENDNCPYISNIIDNNLILSYNDHSYIYDYANDKIINNQFVNYYSLNDKYYLATDSEDLYYILDLDGNILLDKFANKIIDYNGKYVAYIVGNKVGLKDLKENNDLEPEFDSIMFVNDNYMIVSKDNKYYFTDYKGNSINKNVYNYLYAIDEHIIVCSDNTIDIFDSTLKSTLLLKIDTYYSYEVGKERSSLSSYVDNNILYFKVIKDDNTAIVYKYDLLNNKLI